MDNFNVTPYEELPITELGIEELESRLEMSSTTGAEVDVMVEVSVSW